MKTRKAYRALLVTPEQEILLMHMRVHGAAGSVWLIPGGGGEAGEAPKATLQREVYEETGLANVQVGDHVWTSKSKFLLNGNIVAQTSHYYLCPCKKFAAKPVHLEAGDERNGFIGFRWWRLNEIEGSRETFGPRNLAKSLTHLFAEGVPVTPIMLGNWDFTSA